MNEQEIPQEAGSELDAEIAEKVMGLVPCSDPMGRCERAHMTPIQCWGTGGAGSELRPYSTDIAAAWEVLEKMRENRDTVFELIRTVGGGFHCTFIMEHLGGPERPYGDTAPHAICLAALRAVGVEAKEDSGVETKWAHPNEDTTPTGGEKK